MRLFRLNPIKLRSLSSVRQLKLSLALLLALVAGAAFGGWERPTQAGGGTVCGLLRYSHKQGRDIVYKGVGTGCVMLVDGTNGRVNGTVNMYIFPGNQYVLRPNQGWSCQCR